MTTLSQHIAELKNLLKMIATDYDHPWPNEDADTKEHRLRRLSQMREFIAEHEKVQEPVVSELVCQHCGKPESEHHTADKWCRKQLDSMSRFTPAATGIQPAETGYRMLEAGEVIQNGDEWIGLSGSEWHHVKLTIGLPIMDRHSGVYRRKLTPGSADQQGGEK